MFFYSTYQKQGFHTIDNYEDFKALVCSIHGTFGKRTIMEAGIFKTVNNELKSGYKFVDKTKLEGTLRQGFEMGKALDSNIKK